jgi:broad specificity phosphatase PhoE
MDDNDYINNFRRSINSLIVTHNARLRCLVTKLFNNSLNSVDENNGVQFDKKEFDILRKQYKKFRWRNSCVLKLILRPYTHQDSDRKVFFELSLIHDGDGGKRGYNYWSNKGNSNTNNRNDNIINNDDTDVATDENNRPDTLNANGTIDNGRNNKFDGLEGYINFSHLNDTGVIGNIKEIDKEYIFLLVRHGEAEHNKYKKTTIIRQTDTDLIDSGRTGAEMAGKAINNYLKTTMNGNTNEHIKIDYYFVSDLKRTRETFEYMLHNIEKDNLSFVNNDEIKIIVLPCSHELVFDSDGQCDDKKNLTDILTSENKVSCTKLNKYNENTNEYENCNRFISTCKENNNNNDINITIVLDWTDYTKFYGNSYRYIDPNPFKKKQGERCRNTSMIEQAISIITGQNNYEEMIKKTMATGTMYNEERELLSRRQPQRQPQRQGGKNKRKTKKRRKTKKLRKFRNKRKMSRRLYLTR